MTITGTNVAAATAVNFGPNGATNVIVVSSTQITATSPPGSGTVDVTVTTPSGTSATSTADQFTYNARRHHRRQRASAVSGGAPATVAGSGATVAGTVNPESLQTTAFFQYGLDLSFRGPGASTNLYDQSTPPQQVGPTRAAHTVSAPLTGLVPGALYHVRLVATNTRRHHLRAGPDVHHRPGGRPAAACPGPERERPARERNGVHQAGVGPVRSADGRPADPLGRGDRRAHGTLKLTTALPGGTGGARDAAAKGKKPKPNAKTQSGNFGGAIFKVTQARNGLTNLSLVEGAYNGAPTYATCKTHKAGDAIAAALSSKTLQLLHASAHGKFRTTAATAPPPCAARSGRSPTAATAR